jgi:hypothetical protein
MTTRKDQPDQLDDLEKPHPLAVDGVGDSDSEPLAVRVIDPWSDFLRVADKRTDPDAPQRSSSAVPLLDDMKGIAQWD